MKASQLKSIIRTIVKEEIKNSFKEELQNNLVEIISNSNQKNESVNSSVDKSSSLLENTQSTIDKISEKQNIKYTTNPVLNQILNETKGGIPQEGSMVGLMGGDLGMESKTPLNESVQTHVDENAPKEVKSVMNMINKDYSSLLKAIDDKRGKK